MAEDHLYEKYRDLAEKWLNGTITPEEEKEYVDWYNNADDAPLYVPPVFAADRSTHRLRLLRRLQKDMTPVIPIRTRMARISVAAVLVMAILGSAGYFLLHRPGRTGGVVTTAAVASQDVAPGISGAILRLANGQTIVLDTARNGLLTSAVTKSGGSLAFATAGRDVYPPNAYNTLSTPSAHQQQLTLPDGTRIWLNAESSVRFPSVFTGLQRIVEITGEAYFEVAQDASHPFIVKVKGAEVEVLGTHFNVMAYAKEAALETTLLEGVVKFRKGESSVLLKPGQQSRLLPDDEVKLVPDADVETATAWKNGLQAFKKADIQTIMRQVKRWYNVEVAYEGAAIPANITFTGEVPRDVNLSQLLKAFETPDLYFRVDGEQHKVTVIYKKEKE
jgi:hypothetical protein